MSDQDALIKLAIDEFVQTAASSHEEKEAAHKLAKKYGPLLENFNDVVFITDKAGHFLFVNKASEERTGIPTEFFIGRHFLEIIDQKYHEFAQSSFQKAMREEKVIPAIEMERQTESGKNVTLEINWKVLSENNAVVGFMGFSRDVTDRKLAQEALRIARDELKMQNEELRQAQKDLEAERDKYSDLYDFAPVGYFTISDKGLILGANLMGATMLGLERGKLKNIYFTKFIANDYQDAFYRYRRKLIKTELKQTCEMKITKKDGTEFYAQLESSPVKDEAGNCNALRSSLSDINERKQTELALIESKLEVESIVKTVPDIIYRLDPQGRLTFVSDSVKRYGYQPEELIGTNVMRIVYPEDRSKTIHRIKERRTGSRSTKSFETRLVSKTQTAVPFDVFIISSEGLYSPTKSGLGNFLGTQGIARDITMRKQAEVERERLIIKLQEAIDSIKTLKGLLPICANCKKIRDDNGYWNQIEAYIRDHSEAEFSHSICPECVEKLYGEFTK